MKKYIASIDGIRMIAVLAVIIYHMGVTSIFRGGFTGVDIFFVVSGYVISMSLAKKANMNFWEYLGEFYKKRVLRIVPALTFCLVVTMFFSTLFIPSAWLSSTISNTGLSAFFGISNFELLKDNNSYFHPKVDFNPFLHTWSLGIEEQFYVIFPVLYYFWLKTRDQNKKYRNLALISIVLLSIGSFISCIITGNNDLSKAFYLLPNRLWELMIGVLLFMLHFDNLCKAKSKLVSNLLSITGILMIYTSFAFSTRDRFPYPFAVLPVLGTVLLISGLIYEEKESTMLIRIFKSKLISYIGRISFSLYLWHWPVAVLLRWTIGFETLLQKSLYLILSFALATLSYHLIEKPVRYNQTLLKQKNYKLILSGVLTIFLSFFTSYYIDKNREILSLSVTKDTYNWHAYKFKYEKREQKIFDNDVNGKQIFVLGDSHTAAYRTMLTIAEKDLKIKVYEFEQGGAIVCNILKAADDDSASKAFYENSFAQIKEAIKPGDIVFLASLRMPELCDAFEVIDQDEIIKEHFSETAVEERKRALKEATQIIKEFEALGAKILIDAPKPVLKAAPYRSSDWFNKNNSLAKPGLDIDKELLLKLRKPVMESLEMLDNNFSSVYIWDPFFILANSEKQAKEDGKSLFFDGDHLSAYGNRVLVSDFENKLISIFKE